MNELVSEQSTWTSASQVGYNYGPSYFLYDGDDPVVEEAPDGSLLSANMFGLDGPRAQYVPGTNYCYQQGGVNDETNLNTFDPQGNLVQRMSVQTNPSNYTQFAGVHDTRVYDAFSGLLGMSGTSGQLLHRPLDRPRPHDASTDQRSIHH